MNIIAAGELLTTVANISNLLPTFNGGTDEGWISFRSTPATDALDVEFVWLDWEYAYRTRDTSPNGKPRMVKVTSTTKMGSNIKHCFVLQSCISDVLSLSPYYLCLSKKMYQLDIVVRNA